MIITIPFKTPTVNHLYTRNRFGNQCKTSEANKLKKHIVDLLQAISIDPLRDPPAKLKVVVEVYEDWLTKAGEVKKKDVANREKFLIDSIFEALGLDDRYIYELIVRKIQSDNEQAIIRIERYTL